MWWEIRTDGSTSSKVDGIIMAEAQARLWCKFLGRDPGKYMAGIKTNIGTTQVVDTLSCTAAWLLVAKSTMDILIVLGGHKTEMNDSVFLAVQPGVKLDTATKPQLIAALKKLKVGQDGLQSKLLSELRALVLATLNGQGDKALSGKLNPRFLPKMVRPTTAMLEGIIEEATIKSQFPSFFLEAEGASGGC